MLGPIGLFLLTSFDPSCCVRVYMKCAGGARERTCTCSEANGHDFCGEIKGETVKPFERPTTTSSGGGNQRLSTS